MSTPRYIVNTDLDATLLDHDTYSWQPAAEAIGMLKERGIPLILNSSKTLAEMQELAGELGLNHPLVCENGAFIAFPRSGEFEEEYIREHFTNVEVDDAYILCHLGISRDQFIGAMNTLREENEDYQFLGYADWSVEQVAEHTGLPIEKAELSKARKGTEPIHWHGSEEAFEEFEQELRLRKLKCVAGGRFIHISGLSDKAHGMQALSELYGKRSAEMVVTIALGDSPNDLGMLSAADIAVVIPNKVALEPSAHEVIKAALHGPADWNASIKSILER